MRTLVHPVVAGYDGSTDSEQAIGWAVSAATSRKTPLRIVAVHDERAPANLSELAEQTRDRAAQELAGAVDSRSGLPVTLMQPRMEPVTHALLRLASDAQLVVVGARGHGALSGLLMGSVSQHLARHAPCPVAVVRKPHSPRARRIVVGFDDSPGSRPAAEYGFETASARGVPLTVLHAWRLSIAGPIGQFMPLAPDLAQAIGDERARVREALTVLAGRYPDVKLHVEAVPAHPTLALADASQHAALVVVGARGRGAFAGMLLGSVSQGVLLHAQCTVVIAR